MKKLLRIVQEVISVQNDIEMDRIYLESCDIDNQEVAHKLAVLFSPVGTPVVIFGKDVETEVLAETTAKLEEFASKYKITELDGAIKKLKQYISDCK